MEKPRVMKLEMETSSLSYTSFPQQKSSSPKVMELSAEEDTEISIFDAQRYFNESNNDARVCKRVSPLNLPNLNRISSDGCDLSSLSRFSSASSATDGYGNYGGRNYRVRSFHATPTASSEASWNSQTGLLSNPPGAIAVTMKNPTIDHDKKKASDSASASPTGNSKIKWLWGRRCPCSGKKSVQVEPKTPLSLNQKLKLDHDQKSLGGATNSSWGTEKREEILIPCNPHRISAENQQFHHSSLLGPRVVASATPRPLMINDGSAAAGFTFPVLHQQPIISSSSSSQVRVGVNRINNVNCHEVDDEDQARDSLEVFRPPEKKLVCRISNITDDDVGSDTSSDLFEIESFSTTTQGQTTPYPMYHRRDSLDEASSSFNARRSMMAAAAATNGSAAGFGCPYSQMMTECYEPSEASIDWSVTTAEGFERGSVGVSEMEEAMSMAWHGNGNGNGHGGGKKKTGNGGGLLSCRCEKAVSVGPNPVKYVTPQRQPTSTSKHVANVNKPPLARLSLPFAA